MKRAPTSPASPALLAGIDAPGVTVNRYCSSSLQTIRMAAHAIKAGEGDVFISGGVETVSRFMNGMADGGPANAKFERRARPHQVRVGRRPADVDPAGRSPRRLHRDGPDRGERARGRERRAARRWTSSAPARSSSPCSSRRTVSSTGRSRRSRTPDGTVVTKDDGPRAGTTVEKLATLKPVFRPDGKVTAGNACPLNDGAAAVIVMSDTKAKELGIKPLARIVASGVSALNPEIMGLGPIEACRQALKRANMTIDDIDLVEINEAFAAQVIPSAKHLGIPLEKLNVHGGAIALGHPFGMTGARIMTTLINGLETEDKRYGLETMCVGGGQGMAMIIERL